MTSTKTDTLPAPVPPPPPVSATPPKAKAPAKPKASTRPKAVKPGAVKKATAKATPAKAQAGTQGNATETAKRDAQVLAFIKGAKKGRTLEEIMKKFGLERNIAYLSTYRGQNATPPTITKERDGSRTPRYVATGA